MSFLTRIVLFAALTLAVPALAQAQSDCRFRNSGNVMLLLADCRTSASIEIPDGMTLDGNGHAIIAVDPPEGPFSGAVVVARGGTASIRRTRITTDQLANTCAEGDARLRGIYFDGASGEIALNFIEGVHRFPSSCEEGNAIEVRNRARDGTFTAVTVSGNYLDAFQKTGIVVQGNVQAVVRENVVGTSVAARPLVPNGIEVGVLAIARVERNRIGGVFSGVTAAGSAMLLTESGAGTIVNDNDITGNPDVGIYVAADGVTVSNNRLVDSGGTGPYGIGIVNLGLDNVYFNNSVIGFNTRDYGMESASRRAPQSLQVE